MKSRVSVDRRTKQQTLTITSRKGETLNLHQAIWAASLGLYCVLFPGYHVSSETGLVTLVYSLDGMTSLRDYVRKYQVTRQDLATWMCDLAQAYGRCTDGGEGRYWQRSLLFDEELVFVDASRHMRFVFVPLDGMVFRLDNTPLATLSLLSDVQRVTYGDADDQAYAARLASYVLGEQNTFSFNTYRALLSEMCGVMVTPSGEIKTAEAKTPPRSVSRNQASSSPRVADPMADLGDLAKVRRAVMSEKAARMSAAARTPVRTPAGRGNAAQRTSGGAARAQVGGAAPRSGAPATRARASATSAASSASRQARISSSAGQVRAGQGHPSSASPAAGRTAAKRQYVLRRLKTGKTYHLQEGQKIVLGRGSNCSLSLQGDSNISRRHVSIVLQAGQAKITDLGSRNGTVVNGKHIKAGTAARTNVPCRLVIGAEEFVVE